MRHKSHPVVRSAGLDVVIVLVFLAPIFPLVNAFSKLPTTTFPLSSSPRISSSPITTALNYKILGGLPEDEDSNNQNTNQGGDAASSSSSSYFETRETHDVYLRHFENTMRLFQQSKENDGSVSQAGTPWEASGVLADFITHPQSGINWKDQTVLELGSGIGLAAICASIMGANVIATDAATTSLNLIRENTALYSLERPVSVLPLLWGDYESLAGLPKIDIVMASDVVYFRSNTDGLKRTIEALCGPTTLVIIAHTFRTEPEKDMEFFDSLVQESMLERQEVEDWLLPQGYNQRRDGRLPVTIFLFRRRSSNQFY